MSVPERIRLAEDIWDTIGRDDVAVSLTAEDKRVLDVRLESHGRNKEAGSSWQDVRRRVSGR